MTYPSNDAPFDLFAEIVPVLDLAPSTAIRIDLAVGGRFYFQLTPVAAIHFCYLLAQAGMRFPVS